MVCVCNQFRRKEHDLTANVRDDAHACTHIHTKSYSENVEHLANSIQITYCIE